MNFKLIRYIKIFSDVMEILTMQPKDRSVPQLTTLTKFLGATEFMQGMKSAMVQRNCCRFLTLSTFAQEERIYTYGTAVDKMHIVLLGSCVLETGKKDDAERLIDIGDMIGGEELVGKSLEEAEAEGFASYTYRATATAVEPLVVASISAQDYVTTCSLESIQRVIDMYWNLGIDYQKKLQRKKEKERKEALSSTNEDDDFDDDADPSGVPPTLEDFRGAARTDESDDAEDEAQVSGAASVGLSPSLLSAPVKPHSRVGSFSVASALCASYQG